MNAYTLIVSFLARFTSLPIECRSGTKLTENDRIGVAPFQAVYQCKELC